MSLQKNLTVLFTNRSTLPLLKPAISSFLKFYPELKSCILVFDDIYWGTKNDFARKWLTKQEIRWTSWQKFKKLYPILIEQSPLYYTMRYSYILHDILPRITTPKVLICDSDILFLRGGFIEQYWKELKKGAGLVCPVTWYPTRIDVINPTKYAKLSAIFPDKPCTVIDDLHKESMTLTYYIKRFHSYFSLLNLEKLRNFGLYHDDISDKEYLKLHCDLDTNGGIPPYTFFNVKDGVNWFYRIMEKGISYYDNDPDQYNHRFSFSSNGDEKYAHTNNPKTFVYHLKDGANRIITSQPPIQDVIRLNKPSPGSYPDTDRFTEELYNTLTQDIQKDPALSDIFKEYYPWMFE